MSLDYRVGDVFDRLAEIPDNSVDLIVTSPPFLALRSYLPDDHEHKHLEIGSEATPAEFIDTLLALTVEWGRVLAPHGSLCVELGDTYSGQSAGVDNRADETGRIVIRTAEHGSRRIIRGASRTSSSGPGWPLAKSLAGIPTLYPWSLAYGRNLLTGADSPAGQWRIRNMIVWARPNPPVGALGDKFRPATSYITVACQGPKRYFDLDAVRTEPTAPPQRFLNHGYDRGGNGSTNDRPPELEPTNRAHPAGAPPLDWHQDPEDGDWLWKLSTQPYKGSHYATFPMALPKRLIEAMCPLRVCTVCGEPSTLVTGDAEYVNSRTGREVTTLHFNSGTIIDGHGKSINSDGQGDRAATRVVETLGWTDCGHDAYRVGRVLDPFAGSGTTLEAAQAVGRHAIGIDLDPRNAELARQRVGMFMTVDGDVT